MAAALLQKERLHEYDNSLCVQRKKKAVHPLLSSSFDTITSTNAIQYVIDLDRNGEFRSMSWTPAIHKNADR